MINLAYRAATLRGRWARAIYRAFLPMRIKQPIAPAPPLAVTVYAFSGKSDCPEQIASIRSFLRHVGVPTRFVVVSDGTHQQAERAMLERVSPCVTVIGLDQILAKDLPDRLRKYAQHHPLGKKVSVLVSLPIDGPTIYSDSDIFYFPKARIIPSLVHSLKEAPRFLLDCYPSLDERLLESETEKNEPVNSGFLILGRRLDWSAALKRLDRLPGDAGYFTEQTLVHLAVHASHGQPLDPERFILRADDQCIFPDRHAHKEIALRHYISSIRYKFWYHAF